MCVCVLAITVYLWLKIKTVRAVSISLDPVKVIRASTSVNVAIEMPFGNHVKGNCRWRRNMWRWQLSVLKRNKSLPNKSVCQKTFSDKCNKSHLLICHILIKNLSTQGSSSLEAYTNNICYCTRSSPGLSLRLFKYRVSTAARQQAHTTSSDFLRFLSIIKELDQMCWCSSVLRL